MKSKVIITVASATIFLFGAIACTTAYVNKHKGTDNMLTASSFEQNKSVSNVTNRKNSLDFSKHIKLSWVHSSIEPGIRKAKEEIAKRYMELHPNIEIETIVRHPKDYYEWVKARLAANIPPDIITVDSSNENTLFDKRNNWFVDLRPYLGKRNPYTGLIWQNEFYPTAAVHERDECYTVVPYQLKVSKFIYNTKHFKEIGLTRTPRTWEEFITVLEKLKNKGYIPFGVDISSSNNTLSVLNSLMMDQIYYSKMSEVDVLEKDGIVEENEMVRAVDMGILDMKNPDTVKMLKLYKEFTKYWNKGFAESSDIDLRDMFIKGKVSIILASSWDTPAYTRSKDLEWGVFPFPVLNKELIPSSIEKVLEPGQIQDEHAVTKAAELRGTKDYAIDFLMTFSSYDSMVLLDEAFGVYPVSGSGSDDIDIFGGQYAQFSQTGEILPYISPMLYDFNDNTLKDNIYKQTILLFEGQITPEKYVDVLSEQTLGKVEEIKQEKGWNKQNNYQDGK